MNLGRDARTELAGFPRRTPQRKTLGSRGRELASHFHYRSSTSPASDDDRVPANPSRQTSLYLLPHSGSSKLGLSRQAPSRGGKGSKWSEHGHQQPVITQSAFYKDVGRLNVTIGQVYELHPIIDTGIIM
jgi:hypothetical protein